jgi:hypothetical protein
VLSPANYRAILTQVATATETYASTFEGNLWTQFSPDDYGAILAQLDRIIAATELIATNVDARTAGVVAP